VGGGIRMHGVYGGVSFQLEQVPTMRAARLPRADTTAATAQSLALAGGGKARSFGKIPGVTPQGVDLNLNHFDLSTLVPRPCHSTGDDNSGVEPPPDSVAVYGKAFRFSLACRSGSIFKAEDKHLFQALFNPHLSDRLQDGDHFVPPHTSFGHIQKLRGLLGKEEEVRRQRKSHFLSRDFLMDDAGSLYPASWQSSIAVARERVREGSSTMALSYQRAWSPSGAVAMSLEVLLRTTAPIFDKSTEDGLRFRIYRAGSLELRTTQEHDGGEVIGVVFSFQGADSPTGVVSKSPDVANDEKVTKVTEYVEAALAEHHGPRCPHNYFVVVTTEGGHAIAIEKLRDGTVAWAENPGSLDARCLAAKVTGCSHTCKTCITVRDLRSFWAVETQRATRRPSPGDCKCFARTAFSLSLPVKQKYWAALTESQRQAAVRLGVQNEPGWDERSALVWRSTWWDLNEEQRGAALQLGMTDDSWDSAAEGVEHNGTCR